MNLGFPPVPAELQYIADLAAKTRFRNEGFAYDHVENASPSELLELKRVADRMLQFGHHSKLMRWMDGYDITEWEGSGWMYFLLFAMDAKEYKFD